MGKSSRVDAGRASNLDLTRSVVVRKGCLVSQGGWRIRVQRVRLGQLYGFVVALSGQEFRDRPVHAACSSVQVVGS